MHHRHTYTAYEFLRLVLPWVFIQNLNSFLGVYSILGSIIGGAIGLLGNKMSSDANKEMAADQNAANLELAKIQNDYNREIFDESRGSKGSAVLPLYFGTSEKEMADDFVDSRNLVDESLGGSEGILNRILESMKRAEPAKEAASDTLNSAFAGDTLAKQLEGIEGQRTNRDEMAELLLKSVGETQDKQAVVSDARTGLGAALARAIESGADTKENALTDFAGVESSRANLADAYQAVLDGRRANVNAINESDFNLAETQAAAAKAAGNKAINKLKEGYNQNGISGGTLMANAIGKAMLDTNNDIATSRGEAKVRAAERLSEINDADAGFYSAQLGADTEDERRLATVEAALQQAIAGERSADVTGSAALQNAIDSASIPNEAEAAFEGRKLIDDLFDKTSQAYATDEAKRLSLMDEPYTVANKESEAINAVLRSIYSPQLAEQDALNFFRLGESRAPSHVSTPAAVVAPGSGAAIGNTLAQTGSKMLGNAIEDFDFSSLFKKKE